MTTEGGKRLRSQAWFDNRDNVDMTSLYVERYLNYGLTREELQSLTITRKRWDGR